MPTQRLMLSPGKFQINIDLSAISQGVESDCAFIVDDVVASGQTAVTIAEGIKRLKPGLPCFMVSWLFLRPSEKLNQRSPSGLSSFEKAFCALALKGNYVSRPPINSLSCFLREDPKGQEVKSGYFQKYVTDPEAFQEQLEKIRSLL